VPSLGIFFFPPRLLATGPPSETESKMRSHLDLRFKGTRDGRAPP
jgi:hypothetical protein